MKQKIEIICVHCGCLVENCACNKIDWRVIAYGRKQDVKQLEAENKRLREALTEIAESDEIAQHIAQQANEELDRKTQMNGVVRKSF